MNFTAFWKRTLLFACLTGSPIYFLWAQGDNDNFQRQDRFTLYYSDSWELTTPDKAAYTREGTVNFIDMVFYGVFKDYSREHKLVRDGFYDDQGVKRGLHTEYFQNGSVKSTMEYAEEGFIIWELTNDMGENEVTRGTGKFTVFYYNFEQVDRSLKLVEGVLNGEFLNGKRTGTWTYKKDGGQEWDEELYERGMLTKRTSVSASGTVELHEIKPVIISLSSLVTEAFSFDPSSYTHLNQFFEQYGPAYPTTFQRSITFPGGIKKLLLLLSANYSIHTDEVKLASVTVDENGNLTKIKMGGRQDLQRELERTIKPFKLKFLPAVANGKAYESTVKIPISNDGQWISFLQNSSEDAIYTYLATVNQD